MARHMNRCFVVMQWPDIAIMRKNVSNKKKNLRGLVSALGVVGARKPHEATHTKEESWSSVCSHRGAKRLRRTGRNLRCVSKNTNENNEHEK